MKKILIGSFVGAIVLFIWSFLAWAILPIHLHTVKYTLAQDSLLQIMANNNLESGTYGMPMADNRNVSAFDSKYHEEMEKKMKENAGKPMASVYYLKEGYNMGATTMLRGFLFNFLAVFAASILLAPAFTISNSFFGRWWLTLVVGLFLNACGPLIQYNWMAMPWNFTVDMVIDNFLNWGVVGLWFAYYYKGK
ncbi:MAG: hypothetical protein ABI855_01205 [Bacteroidota bacterium]